MENILIKYLNESKDLYKIEKSTKYLLKEYGCFVLNKKNILIKLLPQIEIIVRGIE